MSSVRAARFRGREISLLQDDLPKAQGKGEKKREREGLGRGSGGRDERQRLGGRQKKTELASTDPSCSSSVVWSSENSSETILIISTSLLFL